jgi:hypothetical protein
MNGTNGDCGTAAGAWKNVILVKNHTSVYVLPQLTNISKQYS